MNITVQGGVASDVLTWVALEQPGTDLPSFEAVLHLPKPVSDQTTIKYKLLGIHGVGTTSAILTDPQTISYTATGIGPEAIVSVIAEFPKGYLNLPIVSQAKTELVRLNVLWIWLSVLGSFGSMLVLLYLVFQRWRDHHIPISQSSDGTIPASLPPGLIAVLYANQIEPEAIAATLLDLARRGYLTIFKKGGNFIFAKEKEIDLSSTSFQIGNHDIVFSQQEKAVARAEGLHEFEKILLSKIFVSSRPIASKEDVKVRIAHGFFSKKVAAVYLNLFGLASSLGQFVPAAASVHRKYLMAGWFVVFIGFIGFLIGAWQTPEPKYFLLLWAGIMVVGYAIHKIAAFVPIRSQAGRNSLAKFLSLREFFVQKEPIPPQWNLDNFFEYLPYAWSLQAHESFAKRFAAKPFHRPRWYFTSKKIKSSVEFVADLEPLVEFVAESFASVREKTLV
ncbi:DUF2207 domain-containing protein [Candidatus Berkelbacteria bacterium]|nr:DUF2207 domain-containing protein [Candidatus Berkelbacteria bacterium]